MKRLPLVLALLVVSLGLWNFSTSRMAQVLPVASSPQSQPELTSPPPPAPPSAVLPQSAPGQAGFPTPPPSADNAPPGPRSASPALPGASPPQAPQPGEPRIPASFTGGPRQFVLDYQAARARVAREPAFLLSPQAFSSLVYRADLRWFAIKPTDVVLDVGCGTGALEFRLMREGIAFKTLYAADVDKVSIDFLTEAIALAPHPACARVKPLINTREDVGLPPGSLDVAIIYNTPIGTVPPKEVDGSVPATDRPFVNSLYRAMRPGGRVYYTIFVAPRVYSSVRPFFEAAGFRTVEESYELNRNNNFLSLVLERPAQDKGHASPAAERSSH